MGKFHSFPAKETDPEERNGLEGARKVTAGLRKNWITGDFFFLVPSIASLASGIAASALSRDRMGYGKITTMGLCFFLSFVGNRFTFSLFLSWEEGELESRGEGVSISREETCRLFHGSRSPW